MACRSVKLVKKGDEAEPVEVRVIRKWQSYVFTDECCYVFVDKEGCAIEAHGNKRDIEHKINLNSTYRVSNYLSVSHRKSHNVVPHPATIRLARGTSFLPIDTEGFPHYYFNFHSFEGLRKRLGSSFLLTDYIGRFDSFTADQTTRSGRRLLKFTLEDSNENFIEVAMWSEIAGRIDVNRLRHEDFPCIVAITSMKVSNFERLQLESTSATHIFINPDIEDAQTLAASFRERYMDMPMDNRNRVTIEQLLQKDPQKHADRRFTCLATIADFVHGRTWYYKGCVRCNKKLSPRSTSLVCGDHPDEEQPKFLYCMSVIIADETGTTTVTMFDAVVMSLIQTTCHTLVVQEGHENPDMLPEPLHAIRGMTKVFELRFNYKVQPKSNHFIVCQILDQDDIPEEVPPDNPDPQPAPATVQQGLHEQQQSAEHITDSNTRDFEHAGKAQQFVNTMHQNQENEPNILQDTHEKTANATAISPKAVTPKAGSKLILKQPATPAMAPPAKRKLEVGSGYLGSKRTHPPA